MDEERTQFILARAAKAAELARQESEQAELEALELAEAMVQAEQWRAEYSRILSARPGLRAELAQLDAALPAAVASLEAAHTAVTDLLTRRATAEQQVRSVHHRLSRLAGWLGDRDWRSDIIPVSDVPLPWSVVWWVSHHPWSGS